MPFPDQLQMPSRPARGVMRRVRALFRRAYGEDLFDPGNPWMARLTGFGLSWPRKMRRAPWAWATVLAAVSILWGFISAVFLSPLKQNGDLNGTWISIPFLALSALAVAGFACGIEARRALLRESLLIDALLAPAPLRDALAAVRARVAAWSVLFSLLYLIIGMGACIALAADHKTMLVSDKPVIGALFCMAPVLALTFGVGIFYRSSSSATSDGGIASWSRGLFLSALCFPMAILRWVGSTVISSFILLAGLAFIYWGCAMFEYRFRMFDFFGQYWLYPGFAVFAIVELRVARDRIRDSRILWNDYFYQAEPVIRRELGFGE